MGNWALLFAIIAAAPLCVLPSKDTVEELFYKDDGMSKKQNIMVTFILVIINCSLGCLIPSIGSAMTLVGSSINPVIGFIMPVIFYWSLSKDKPWYSYQKLLGATVVLLITVVSIMSLVKFFNDLANGN